MEEDQKEENYGQMVKIAKDIINKEDYDGRMVKVDEDLYVCKFWRPAVAVDAVLFAFGPLEAEVHSEEEQDSNFRLNEEALQVLLIKRGGDPYKDYWALPGGFMRKYKKSADDEEGDKSAEDAVMRELSEETQLTLDSGKLKQLGVFSEVGRDPRDHIISVPFYALVLKRDFKEVKGGADAKEAKWFPIAELPELAFDHKNIIDKALKELQKSVYVEPIARDLLNSEFTIRELHGLYRAILYPDYYTWSEEKKKQVDAGFDKSNLLKKLRRFGYIKDTDETDRRFGFRPLKKLTFDEVEYEKMKDGAVYLEYDYRKKSDAKTKKKSDIENSSAKKQ